VGKDVSRCSEITVLCEACGSRTTSSSISEIVHSNFLLEGHLWGMVKEIEGSSKASLMITFQASELRKFLVQSKQVGFSKDAMKKNSQPKGTCTHSSLPPGAKYVAHNLTPQ
jgi:hypothetical protein